MLLYWDGRVSRSHVGLTVISVAMLVSKQTMFMLIFQIKIWELPNRSARHAVRTVALLVGVMLTMQGRMAVEQFYDSETRLDNYVAEFPVLWCAVLGNQAVKGGILWEGNLELTKSCHVD